MALCVHVTKCVVKGDCVEGGGGGGMFFVVTLFRNVLTLKKIYINLISPKSHSLNISFSFFFIFKLLLWGFVIVVEKLRLVNVVNVVGDLLVNMRCILFIQWDIYNLFIASTISNIVSENGMSIVDRWQSQ